jgi:hypothetical protein
LKSSFIKKQQSLIDFLEPFSEDQNHPATLKEEIEEYDFESQGMPSIIKEEEIGQVQPEPEYIACSELNGPENIETPLEKKTDPAKYKKEM